MPFVRLTVTPVPTAEAARRLAEGATRLMAEVLGKKPSLTSVLVEAPPVAAWTIGATSQAKAAHLEALVTQGTNSEEEKRTFLRRAMDLLSDELGTLPEATYVVVRDIPAEDWGYGGLSQADRRPKA
jgi:4-oxalocrotonate tautomerase